MNSSNDYDGLLHTHTHTKKYYSESKISGNFSPATMAGYPKLNGFCSGRRLTTIDFKELFNAALFFFVFFCFLFALITVF